MDKQPELRLFCPIIRDTCRGEKCMFWRDDDCAIMVSVLAIGERLRTVTEDVVDEFDTASVYDAVIKEIIASKREEAFAQEVAQTLWESSKEYALHLSDVDQMIEEELRSRGIDADDLSFELSKALDRITRAIKKSIDEKHKESVATILSDHESLLTQLVDYGMARFEAEGYSGVPDQTDEFWEDMGIVDRWNLAKKQQTLMKSLEQKADKLIGAKIDEIIETRRKLEDEAVKRLVPDFLDWMRGRGGKSITLKEIEAYLARKGIELLDESIRLMKNLAQAEFRG